ncbi:hypothetical protein [Actinacidiphila paucisporea]|uniref:Uncharacterized protein n=1 Tax=Actinacidiphila paucisporea TaxID=310782 RepID=A0A1M7N9E5_9ACTN|nr:hypothetical protein SAMN05216499_1189 [Actinacidiphila paucisporea]
MGFALVAVPSLVLLIGPAHGIALANCASGLISAVGLIDTGLGAGRRRHGCRDAGGPRTRRPGAGARGRLTVLLLALAGGLTTLGKGVWAL